MSNPTFTQQLDALLAKIKEHATMQFEYNQTVNVPSGLVAADESAIDAIKSGLASGVNAFLDWDCGESIEVAHSILEDSNCHEEAAALRAVSAS